MTRQVIVPTFQERFFTFEDGVPEHIEGPPSVPNYVGLCAVFGARLDDCTYPLAIDVDGMGPALRLAWARVKWLDGHRLSDKVAIWTPEGGFLEVSNGHSTDL